MLSPLGELGPSPKASVARGRGACAHAPVHEQQIVVRYAGGHEVLWKYWVSPGDFVCHWYRDFAEALATIQAAVLNRPGHA